MAIVLGMAACSRTEPPAPVDLNPVSRGMPIGAEPAVGSRAPAGPAGSYVVQRGDTAYAVARRFELPVKAIIDANNLQPPYGLLVGQRLVIPSQRTHLVERGDTLASVARQYGVDQSALVRANNLQPPYVLAIGQRLALPATVAPAAATTVAAAPPPVMPPPATAVAPPPPAEGTVDVAALPPPGQPAPPVPPPAQAAAAPPPPAAPAPAAPPPAAAAPPPPAPAAAKPPEKPPEAPPAAAEPPPAAPPEKPAAVAAAAPPPAEEEKPEPQQVAAAAPPPRAVTPVGPPPPRAGKTFLWPLRGRVIATFGEQGPGVHNDGINISAPRGTPIKAAENGVVAYAGNEIRGFGNLLLIRHAGGYMTAYAHADALLVKRGDTVHRGQTIARVGQTGNVSEPQLHFEVREGSQPVDPQRYLGSPTA